MVDQQDRIKIATDPLAQQPVRRKKSGGGGGSAARPRPASGGLRLLMYLLVGALVISIAGNWVLLQKVEKTRAQMIINNQKITAKEFHDWLEQHHGPTTMALMVKYQLLTQAANKAGVLPTKEEIDEQVTEQVERNPQVAQQMKTQPWFKDDLRKDVEMNLAALNLTTKEVLATEDEIKDFYNASPNRWDYPTKLHAKLMRAADADTANRAKQLIESLIAPAGDGSSFKAPDLGTLAQQFAPKLELLFADGTWVPRKPYNGPSGDPTVDRLASMKPGSVVVVPVPNGNGASLIMVLEKVEQGKKGELNDPKVRKKVERDFKANRAQPVQELLRGLWDSAEITIDPPSYKANIERVLLPERFQQQAAAAAAGQ